ncbi:MAG TPA: ATP-binding protein [Candidatus Eisenbacteria bacterium]|nr:ATP-binding protein [Candidatus Eisenbacteria bacterium]
MRGERLEKNCGKLAGARGNRPGLLLKLELESNPEALCLVRATIERAAEVLEFPEADTRAIVRSVDEALANVIRHAYGGKAGLPIEVRCNRVLAKSNRAGARGLEILLEDEGDPQKPSEFKGRRLDEVRPGGLGLHFIRQSMDVVEFSRKKGKNQLRLVKYRSPAEQLPGSQGE